MDTQHDSEWCKWEDKLNLPANHVNDVIPEGKMCAVCEGYQSTELHSCLPNIFRGGL